jgi:hypothetical protein
MNVRCVAGVVSAILALGMPAVAGTADQAGAPARAAASQSTNMRTPWGEPDLQGIWSGDTLTPLQRPDRWADKPVLTPEEAAAVEKWVTSRKGREDRSQRGTERDVAGAYNEHWLPPPQKLSDRRTGLILDPSDGKIPPMLPEATRAERQEREYLEMLLAGTASRPRTTTSTRRSDPPPRYNIARMNRSDGPEDRGAPERCFGATMPAHSDTYRIVQSPGQVGIYVDSGQGQGFMRVIPVDGSAHPPASLRFLHGDSRGRWEGNTLVVEVTNFTQKTEFQGSRENLRLIERFTRAGPDRINYRITVEDPTTWQTSWTFEVPWTRQPDKLNMVYESTCHEGNYGLLGMLANTRAAEALFAKGQGPDPNKQDNATGGGTGAPQTVANFPR